MTRTSTRIGLSIGDDMSFSPGEIVTIPSPIDVHAHLREPGGVDKETIASGTRAALHGGYQAVFDMPNNPSGMQTWSKERLDEKYAIAQATANTNIGFYAGVDLENPDIDQIWRMIGKAAGLKLYMGHTTGNNKEHDLSVARPAIDSWLEASQYVGGNAPILLHAREGVGEETAEYVTKSGYPVHWCHISTETEAASCARLTDDYGDLFTAGVTPHHMTMTEVDADFKYGWSGARMMPPLAKEADHEALVRAFNDGYLQILETDHAPHTETDKFSAELENPEGDDDVDCTTCFGVSGIEFVLPIMMSLVQRKKIDMERLVDSLYTQPARMLGLETIGDYSKTAVKVEPYVLGERDRSSKSTNNPYVGWTAWGKVQAVTANGASRFRYQAYPPDFQPKVLRAGSVI